MQNEYILEINVTKDNVTIQNKEKVHNGEYKATKCAFTFTEDFEGLTKKAIFEAGETVIEMLILDNKCDIPVEIFSSDYNECNLRVYGYEVAEENGETVLALRYSPSYDTFPIYRGSYIPNAQNTEEITPTDKEQIEQAITDLDNSKQDNLVSGENIKTVNGNSLVGEGNVEIPIPTELSELDNDTGFIDKTVDDLDNYTKTTDLSEVALSGSYNDLSNTPDLSVYATNEALNNVDNSLQEQIDAITSSADVVDVVGTYAELLAYDTTKLTNNDVIKVLQDSTHSDAISYYRWVINGIGSWSYIGSEGPFYTKTETNTLLGSKQDTINSSNKLDSDLVDDTNNTNKFVTEEEKSDWNAKEDESNKVIDLNEANTDEEYPSAKAVYRETDRANSLSNALTPVRSSGTNITLDDTTETPLKLTLKGNTYQETTTGKNLANIETSATLIGGIPFTIENGIINVNGTAYSASVLFNSFRTNNSNAIFWIEVTGYTDLDNDNSSIILQQSSDNSTWSTFKEIFLKSTSGKSTSATLDSSKYYRIRWYTGNNNTFTNATIKIQLEYGDTKTSWEPFTNGASPNPSYPQNVEVVTGNNTIVVRNKNLLDLTDGTYAPSQGTGITVSSNNNIVTISGTSNGTNIIDIPLLSTIQASLGTLTKSVNPTGTYTGVQTSLRGTSRTLVGLHSHDAENKTGTIDADAYYFRIQINTGITVNCTLKAQLEEGSTATDYIEHQEQAYPINLGSLELCKISTYQDYLYKSGGNWYKKAYIGKVVLNGSENWSAFASVNYEYQLALFPGNSSDTPNQYFASICDKYINNNTTGANLLNYQYSHFSTDAGYGKYRFVRFRNNGITTLENWKTELGTNNLTLYVPLAIPTDVQITDTTLIGQLNDLYYAKSYEKKTNIIAEGNLPIELEVEGIKKVPSKTSELTNDSNFVADASYVHTDNNYTTSEKTQLAGLTNVAKTNANNNFSTAQTINGTLTVVGDISQTGTTYETHAEQLYTAKDIIKTRDGAVGGLGNNEVTGIEALLYDGINNGRLVFDNTGTARVGDVGDEVPLCARDEASNMTNGYVMTWDSTDLEAKTSFAIVTLTQAQYDLLQTKDPNTYYMIEEE